MTKTLTWELRVLAMCGAICAAPALAEDFTPPDILILGDSQLSFGAGPVFLDFFSNLHENCAMSATQSTQLDQLDQSRVSVIGVRSTSVPSWIATGGRAKDTVCKVDPTWRVNAGSYGYQNTSGNQYVQIGQGAPYQFCAAGQSPLQHMFRDDYYDPSLVVFNFLGNSARRWADSPERAIQDVTEMMAQLPDDQACIFMTTAPAYRQNTVDLRLRAQDNLQAAFDVVGQQCTFVEGATPETIAANLGNASHFRRRANGTVKDPFHPNTAASETFFDLQRGAICDAIFAELDPAPAEPFLVVSTMDESMYDMPVVAVAKVVTAN
ncbi:SGNH/GDSL hydrolase family protein [Pseudooctadecabacter jejudonensis]|uniref:SGNH/GDSL hydrolase family protein n=1 Tax=Pseudooctadecabacter jejudonensis TaxID=1391910 RepID=UPI00117A4C00|nr:SGNH/GDSL hydrolase family protein [Pseudooctadecabacter jejudonensis]